MATLCPRSTLTYLDDKLRVSLRDALPCIPLSHLIRGSYSKWPGLNPEKLIAALEADKNKLNELGCEAKLLFLNDGESAYELVKKSLVEKNYDCVLVGAGVRTVPEHLVVFERIINAVHECAPKAKICFNTNPKDTAEAVQRWI